jgi:hypothetical protein
MVSRTLVVSLLGFFVLGEGACTRTGFGNPDGPAAALSDAPGVDLTDLGLDLLPDLAATDTTSPSCLPWSAATVFSAPQPLPFNSSSYDQEPFLSHDGLTLYFSSNRAGGKGGSDLYLVRRPNPSAPFGAPKPYDLLNTTENEWRFIITTDGLTAYLSCDWAGGAGRADLWAATRATPQTPFQRSDFKPLTSLNTADDEHDPYPSADHKRLYYYSDNWESPNSGADLLVALRTGPGTFGKPVPIPGANTFPASEGNPVVTADGLMLVFSSNRAGTNDIWYATRATTTAPFVVQQALPPIVSSPDAHENNHHITPDGCGIYFSRNENLFFAQILPPGGS